MIRIVEGTVVDAWDILGGLAILCSRYQEK